MSPRLALVSFVFLGLWAILAGRGAHAQEPPPEGGTGAAVGGGTGAAPAAAGAASRARLDAFMADVTSFSAGFEQTLYDEAGEPLQSSAGTVLLQRPGRFAWEYTKPAGQRIVADGARVWLYDPDLEQVTVNRIDERVAGTPLVVLMGDAPLDEAFEITPLGPSDGIDWTELTPRGEAADFEAVYLGFDGDALAAMELRDSFGQATQIRFSDFRANVDVPADAFDFTVPDGVDVIGGE